MPVHTAHFCFAQASQTDCVRSRGSACAAGTSTGRRGRCGRGVGTSQRSERCARRAASYCGNTSPPQFFPSPAAARGKLVSSTPCVSSPPAKRGRGVNPPHRIGAPRVLIEPTWTFRSAGNGDGSCRSRHRRHNVDSIVQRVFPLVGGEPGVDLEVHCQLDVRHLARVGPPQCRQPALERPHHTAAVRPSRRLIRKAVEGEQVLHRRQRRSCVPGVHRLHCGEAASLRLHVQCTPPP
ncbi:hypothetical protein DIPPA_27570 [Diplonema papillatum]|nr:hypothetical protein DIPPA_27570 [Diplonema papillatum]